jgi:hypothetical protein
LRTGRNSKKQKIVSPYHETSSIPISPKYSCSSESPRELKNKRSKITVRRDFFYMGTIKNSEVDEINEVIKV